GQNQIADSLQLEEKNFHSPFYRSGALIAPKRSAVTDLHCRVKSSRHAHRGCVCVQQSRSKMVPGKILHDATSGGSAHFLHDFRMPIQMLKRRCNCVHISWLYDDSLNSITNHIARLARGDLRQSARRRFVRDFRAAFPLRGKNVDCPLVEIILRVAHEPDNTNIIPPELL